jgi:hypothetical protein
MRLEPTTNFWELMKRGVVKAEVSALHQLAPLNSSHPGTIDAADGRAASENIYI